MRRKAVIFAMVLTLAINMVPAFSYAGTYLPDLNTDKPVYYTPDYRSGECILSSTKSMFRRAAIARGSYQWDTITNAALRGTATTSGGALRHSFYYQNDGIMYHVTHAGIKGKKSAKVKKLSQMLVSHPEGIVVWGSGAATSGTHGVLLTGYSEGKLYAVDSTHNNFGSNAGIEEWSDTTMKSISCCTDIWYIDSINGKAATSSAPTGPSELAVSDVREPSSIKEGNGFSIMGIVTSNYLISEVTVSIIDASGNTAISQSAEAGSCRYDIAGLDSAVKFGTLAAGVYTYRISASDDKKNGAVLHENSFEIVSSTPFFSAEPIIKKAKAPKIKIKSARVPRRIKEGKDFKFSGTLSSNKRITRVKIQIIDVSGKAVQTAWAKPYTKTYEISRMNKKIDFRTLSKGKYKFRVSAKNSRGWKIVVKKSFRVR